MCFRYDTFSQFSHGQKSMRNTHLFSWGGAPTGWRWKMYEGDRFIQTYSHPPRLRTHGWPTKNQEPRPMKAWPCTLCSFACFQPGICFAIEFQVQTSEIGMTLVQPPLKKDDDVEDDCEFRSPFVCARSVAKYARSGEVELRGAI